MPINRGGSPFGGGGDSHYVGAYASNKTYKKGDLVSTNNGKNYYIASRSAPKGTELTDKSFWLSITSAAVNSSSIFTLIGQWAITGSSGNQLHDTNINTQLRRQNNRFLLYEINKETAIIFSGDILTTSVYASAREYRVGKNTFRLARGVNDDNPEYDGLLLIGATPPNASINVKVFSIAGAQGPAGPAGQGLTTAQANAIIANSAKRSFPQGDETKLDGIENRATADQSGIEIIRRLQRITGGNRLDASAIQNLPAGADIPTPLTNAQIKSQYEANDDTNAFTNNEKDKLNEIDLGAEVNVQSDWNEADASSDAFIPNKPTIPEGADLSDYDSRAQADAKVAIINAESVDRDTTLQAEIDSIPTTAQVPITENLHQIDRNLLVKHEILAGYRAIEGANTPTSTVLLGWFGFGVEQDANFKFNNWPDDRFTIGLPPPNTLFYYAADNANNRNNPFHAPKTASGVLTLTAKDGFLSQSNYQSLIKFDIENARDSLVNGELVKIGNKAIIISRADSAVGGNSQELAIRHDSRSSGTTTSVQNHYLTENRQGLRRILWEGVNADQIKMQLPAEASIVKETNGRIRISFNFNLRVQGNDEATTPLDYDVIDYDASQAESSQYVGFSYTPPGGNRVTVSQVFLFSYDGSTHNLTISHSPATGVQNIGLQYILSATYRQSVTTSSITGNVSYLSLPGFITGINEVNEITLLISHGGDQNFSTDPIIYTSIAVNGRYSRYALQFRASELTGWDTIKIGNNQFALSNVSVSRYEGVAPSRATFLALDSARNNNWGRYTNATVDNPYFSTAIPFEFTAPNGDKYFISQPEEVIDSATLKIKRSLLPPEQSGSETIVSGLLTKSSILTNNAHAGGNNTLIGTSHEVYSGSRQDAGDISKLRYQALFINGGANEIILKYRDQQGFAIKTFDFGFVGALRTDNHNTRLRYHIGGALVYLYRYTLNVDLLNKFGLTAGDSRTAGLVDGTVYFVACIVEHTTDRVPRGRESNNSAVLVSAAHKLPTVVNQKGEAAEITIANINSAIDGAVGKDKVNYHSLRNTPGRIVVEVDTAAEADYGILNVHRSVVGDISRIVEAGKRTYINSTYGTVGLGNYSTSGRPLEPLNWKFFAIL